MRDSRIKSACVCVLVCICVGVGVCWWVSMVLVWICEGVTVILVSKHAGL